MTLGKCQAGQGARPSEAKLIRPPRDCEAPWSDPPCPTSALPLVTVGLGRVPGPQSGSWLVEGGVLPGCEVKVKAAEMAMQCSPAPGTVRSVSPVTSVTVAAAALAVSGVCRARAPQTQARFTALDPNCLRPHGSSSFD